VLKDANVFGVDFNKANCLSIDLTETISVDDSAESAAQIGDVVKAHERWVETSGAEGERADFTGIDLSGMDFSGRNLSAALFVCSRLRSVQFSRAILDLADFTEADLTAAKMMNADLKGANFTHAILRRVNFNGADLRVQTAKLPNGTVYESPVRFIESKFGDTDLSAVQVDRLVAEKLNLAGVKADKSLLAMMVS
jgi:uncharacterized protein YjbI with pentapeptide repeats